MCGSCVLHQRCTRVKEHVCSAQQHCNPCSRAASITSSAKSGVSDLSLCVLRVDSGWGDCRLSFAHVIAPLLIVLLTGSSVMSRSPMVPARGDLHASLSVARPQLRKLCALLGPDESSRLFASPVLRSGSDGSVDAGAALACLLGRLADSVGRVLETTGSVVRCSAPARKRDRVPVRRGRSGRSSTLPPGGEHPPGELFHWSPGSCPSPCKGAA